MQLECYYVVAAMDSCTLHALKFTAFFQEQLLPADIKVTNMVPP